MKRHLPALAAALVLAASANARPVPPSRAAGGPWVDPRLLANLAHAPAADALVVLDPAPDLSAARALASKTARGRWVVDTLRAEARVRQAPLVQLFDAAHAPYRRFWIVDAVHVHLDAPLLAAVRRVPGVRRIALDAAGGQPMAIPPGEVAWPAPPGFAPAAAEWGVARVNAPWAWGEGFTGQGVVVAGQDTGYDWDHPALVRAYRGYDAETGTADHDFNWHDSIHHDIGAPNGNACGYDSLAPCDDHGHGTHTMGTIAGNDLDPATPGWPGAAANVVGAAPGAKWIGCRNMDNGDGTPTTYIECFQWLVAPYPVGGDPFADGDPAMAPDVMNNSWSCPPSEGCTGPEIEPALDAADAAGILVVVSAGNSGSACHSVQDPPAIYPRALAVGATASGDGLAAFSSRGDVTYGGETFLKPDLSAPGVAVRSSLPGTGYGLFSGTSMAGPHVVGVAALLLSAAPELAGQIDLLKAILTQTADPKPNLGCGGDAGGVPNNLYGWGIANARPAIESLDQPATLGGTIRSAGTGAPLGGASVRVFLLGATEPFTTTASAPDGGYSFSLPYGAYRLEGEHPLCATAEAGPLYLVGGRSVTREMALETRLAGDCNNDLTVNAGDVSALVLEVFDGDGTAASAVAGGTFRGVPIGCDANADAVVSAGDLSCTVLIIFNGAGACDPPAAARPVSAR